MTDYGTIFPDQSIGGIIKQGDPVNQSSGEPEKTITVKNSNKIIVVGLIVVVFLLLTIVTVQVVTARKVAQEKLDMELELSKKNDLLHKLSGQMGGAPSKPPESTRTEVLADKTASLQRHNTIKTPTVPKSAMEQHANKSAQDGQMLESLARESEIDEVSRKNSETIAAIVAVHVASEIPLATVPEGDEHEDNCSGQDDKNDEKMARVESVDGVLVCTAVVASGPRQGQLCGANAGSSGRCAKHNRK